MAERVIALVDMDCFYVQVEQRDAPELKGKPCAVVQYKKWKGGAIIAVGYEARSCGVTRQMRGDDAMAKCPEIHLIRVPEVRGKADLTKYREAGAEVIEVLSQFSNCVERASVDEAYIDLTEAVEKRIKAMGTEKIDFNLLNNTYVIGWNGEKSDDATIREQKRRNSVCSWLATIQEADDINEPDQHLAIGGLIVEEMRAAVYRETGFRCSAGVAHNKVLAKLVCGLHKPNKQTLLPESSITHLFTTMPIQKVRGFGGKFGKQVMEKLDVQYMADLQKFSLSELKNHFGKSGTYIYEMCRGIENEPVSARHYAKSIGCGKNFLGKEKLDTQDKVKFWTKAFCEELVERLVKDQKSNKRIAKHLTVNCSQVIGDKETISGSKSCALVKYDVEKISSDVFILLSKFNQAGPNQTFWHPPVINLTMTAGKFCEWNDGATSGNIKSFFPEEKSYSTQQSTAGCAVTTAMPESFQHNTGSSQCVDDQKDEKEKRVQPVMNITSKLGTPISKDKLQSNNSPISKDKLQSNNSIRCFFKSQTEKESVSSEKDDTLNITECNRVTKGFFASKLKNNLNFTENGKSNEKTEKSWIGINSITTNLHQSSLVGEPAQNSTEDMEHSGVLPTGRRFDSSDYMLCDKCQSQVLVWEFPEHEDFHFAQKLQMESSKMKVNCVSNAQSKRKSSERTGVTGPSSKKARLGGCPTLHHFFKK